MKTKYCKAKIKTLGENLTEGQFLVYVSTWTREPDSYGDIVKKGAFAASLARWKELGRTIPGLYGHRMDDPDFFVAGAIDATEDDHGLLILGEFDLDNPKARQLYRLVKGGRIAEMSFAYDILSEGKVKLDDGRTANELRELEIYEFSFVPVGANRDTSIEAVKGVCAACRLKEGRVLAQKHIDSLRGAQEAIGTVIAAAEAQREDQGKASAPEPEEGKDEEPIGVKSSSPDSPCRTSADAYLALITTMEEGM